MKDIWVKILLCLALLGVLFLVGLLGMIMTIFSVSQRFYIPLVMITTGVLMVFVLLRVLGLVKPKTLYSGRTLVQTSEVFSSRKNSGDWDELYFRDYLSSHSDAAERYAELKLGLKEKYEFDRDGYTAAKTGFIKNLTKLARDEMPDKYRPLSN